MRRIALRDLRRDEGLSLVEVVVSLTIFGIIATALAGSVIVLTRVGYTARIRQFATTLAQQTIETNRAIGAGGLAICQSANPPATYTGSQTAYSGKTVVTGTATGCLPYTQTTTSHGINFTVTNWVVQVGSATSAAGFMQYEKALIVTVSWTTPSPGGSYTANTLVQNGTNSQAAGTSTTPTILTVNAQYYNTSTSTWTNITGAQGNAFDVTVTDSNNNVVEGGSGTTGEGTWSSGLITPGTYTCTVTAETSIQSTWTANSTQPGTNENGSADGTSVSGPCTVTDQQTVTFTAYWTGATSTGGSGGTTSCPVVNPLPQGAVKRNLVVTVNNTASPATGINGIPVAVNDGAAGEPGPPGKKNTNASGVVSIPINFYGPVYFSAEPGGDPASYQWSGQQGPFCIQSSGDTSATVSLPSSPTPLNTDSQVYVAISNQDSQPVKTYQVTVSNATTGTTVTGTLTVSNTAGSGGGQTYNTGYITLIVPNANGYVITVSAKQTDGGYNVLQTFPTSGTVNLVDNGGGPTPNAHTYDYSVADASGGY